MAMTDFQEEGLLVVPKIEESSERYFKDDATLFITCHTLSVFRGTFDIFCDSFGWPARTVADVTYV